MDFNFSEKDFPKKYSFYLENSIDNRRRKRVFSIDDGVVMKILEPYFLWKEQERGDSLNNFYKEYFIHKEARRVSLENDNFNIGDVYEFVFSKNLDNGLYYPAIIMEDLGRNRVDRLRGSIREKVEKLYFEQVELAKKLGFFPYDCDLHNGMWKENKVYLFDFGAWSLE